MQAKKHLLLFMILSVCISTVDAYNLPDYLNRLGKKTLSLQHLCMYAVAHPYVLDYVHQHVQDDVVWQKGSVHINKHDICDLCVSMLLEICYAGLCGMRDYQLQDHIFLIIYGALLHTCLQHIIAISGLGHGVPDATKQQYFLYGSNYVKAALACVCNEYIDPSKYW